LQGGGFGAGARPGERHGQGAAYREERPAYREEELRYESGFDPDIPAQHRRAPGIQGPGPVELSNQMEELGNKWADAHAHSLWLDETKASVLAEITLDIMENHHEEGKKSSSKAAAEVRARCSEKYREHLQKMVEAKQRANRARVAYDSFKEKVGLIRTWEANKRSEMNMR